MSRLSAAAKSEQLPLFVLSGIVIAAGIFFRIHDVGSPATLTFDEHHFVENARNYLSQRADWNDHPPAGKLLIATWISLFGDRAQFFRGSSLVAGLLSIALAYLISRELFKSRIAGLLSATFLAADGFFLTYSRTALLDGPLTFFSLLTFWTALRSRTWLGFALVGVLAGAACSIKMSGIAILVTALILVLVQGGMRLLPALITLSVALCVYQAQWCLGLALSGAEWSFRAPYLETLRLYNHHASLTAMTHPLTSSWTTWLLPEHPLVVQHYGHGDKVRVVSTMGNPLLWWSTSITMVAAVATTLWFGVRATYRGISVLDSESFRAKWLTTGWSQLGRPLLLALTPWLLFLAPWILSRRDSYIYHYLPAYAFGIVALGGVVEYCARRFRPSALFAVALVAVVSGFYLPVWTAQPLTANGVAARLFLKGWR